MCEHYILCTFAVVNTLLKTKVSSLIYSSIIAYTPHNDTSILRLLTLFFTLKIEYQQEFIQIFICLSQILSQNPFIFSP